MLEPWTASTNTTTVREATGQIMRDIERDIERQSV